MLTTLFRFILKIAGVAAVATIAVIITLMGLGAALNSMFA